MARHGACSAWQRWDHHLHAPGTLRNDQFGGDWEGYIGAIETAEPPAVALGVTDYFSLRAYKEVNERRERGALPGVRLLFPNVELRLTVETRERQGINLHLLICPDDPDHVARAEEALAQLQFPYRQDVYPCTEDGLRRLGRAYRGDPLLADEAALRDGANQFKVNLDAVRGMLSTGWPRANVLVAVAAGNDGLAGIARDASFSAQREELGRCAHIVFSGNPRDRQYWMGNHADFSARGQSPKPCLHGSDAHSCSSVLAPAEGRRCWIRASPTFDGLRQTLSEPERRVHIGETPPMGPPRAYAIRALEVGGASWLEQSRIELNDGLVAVIGAKGSGKTALVDLLAYGARSEDSNPGAASFIRKAGELLAGTDVRLEWADGETDSRSIQQATAEPDAKVRYLSQGFVERLCEAENLGAPLVEEIERVVFAAVPEEERLQCSTFSELRDLRLRAPVSARRSAECGLSMH